MMNIRKKITLWISGTALLSTIAFSAFVFWGLMDEPFKLIDKEILSMADSLAKQMALPHSVPGQYNLSNMPYNPDAYWIMVKDDGGRILYQSKLTGYTDLSGPVGASEYLVEKNIPRSRIWLGQDDHEDVLFRVMIIREQIDSRPVDIHIGKPIERLEEELIALAMEIGAGLFICVLVIFCMSYILAGRILSPISAITRMSREISENSLDRRIPLKPTKDELYQLSVSLNTMFDRLENSFNRQKEFIGNASHELKSPITLLMLAQEEMLMNDALPPSSTQNLIKQLETSRRMSHLVKNMLDLSRLEQQETLKKESVDLSALLDKVVDDYADVLAAKQIKLVNHVKGPYPVQGDLEKLFRLLVNLIDNAIKYNLDANGLIEIKGEKFRTEVCLEISNTGRHIPEQDLCRVFEQFYRVEKSRSLSHGGSGMGLAIAQKIVSLHHGKITIANAGDNMVRVRVVLPTELVLN